MILIVIITVSLPFLFLTVFLLEDAEPYRRLLRHVFGITEILRSQNVPLILYILFQAFQWCNLLAYLMNILILFIYTMNEWLVYLTVAALRSTIYLKQTSETSDLLIMLREQLADVKITKSYKVLQLLTGILNSEVGKIWFNFHHATLLAVPVICFFGSIRWTEYVSKITVCIAVLVGIISIIIMYFETLLWSILPENSAKLLRVMRRKNTRKSIVGKKIRAGQLIEGGLGKPFYTLSRYSFLIYMEQLLSFLSTLLLSVK